MKVNEYVRGVIGSKNDYNVVRKVVYDNGGNWQSTLTTGLKNLIDAELNYLSKRQKGARRK
jgi:hypothetical protein